MWITIQKLKPSDFQRRVGVKQQTFLTMVGEIIKQINKQRKIPNRSRPCKLGIEDQLLMTLMYWREYRTMFHIATDYGISESSACRTIHKIEDALSKSKKFKLPGKKALSKPNVTFEVMLIDSTESPIERPKKNNNGIIQGRKRNIR